LSQKQKQSSGDLLWGVEAIADHIGRTKRQAQYLIENDKIPVTRLGPKTIVGSRTGINTALKSETSE
jgi:hypothetical protein